MWGVGGRSRGAWGAHLTRAHGWHCALDPTPTSGHGDHEANANQVVLAGRLSWGQGEKPGQSRLPLDNDMPLVCEEMKSQPVAEPVALTWREVRAWPSNGIVWPLRLLGPGTDAPFSTSTSSRSPHIWARLRHSPSPFINIMHLTFARIFKLDV